MGVGSCGVCPSHWLDQSREVEPKKREPTKSTKNVEEAEETEAQRLAPEGDKGKGNETAWAPRARG